MHILRNTGKNIVFRVYNVLFCETSFSKDKKNIELYHFIDIYVWNKKEYQHFVSLYIFWSLNTRLQLLTIENGGPHGKIYLFLIQKDISQ